MKKHDMKWLFAGAVAMLAACSYDGELDGGVKPEPKPGTGAGQGFKISVGGSSGDAATRAEYDGVAYKWSPGDPMGFYMVPAGGSTPVAANARLISINDSPSQFADFEGDISETSIGQVSPDARYDYYSYYPYNAGAAGAGFPNVAFEIPGTINLTPDVFPAEYGFMVADRVTTADGEKPVTWLDEGGKQHFGEHIGFRYRHVFAYLGIYLKVNLMSKPIGKVVITCTDNSPVSGTAHIDLTNGAINFVSGSNSLTVNISGGLTVSTDANKGYLWVPINPALAGKQFRFDFYTTDGFLIDTSDTSTVNGGALESGKKHKAGFLLPFFIDFSQNASGSGKAFYSYGHTMTTNMGTELKDGALELEGSGTANNRDAVKLPLLSTATHPGYNAKSLYVTVKIDAKYETAWFLGQNDYRALHYNVASASEYNIGSTYSFALNKGNYTVFQSANPVFQIGDDKYITFRCRVPTGGSYQYIKRIWVYPRFDY